MTVIGFDHNAVWHGFEKDVLKILERKSKSILWVGGKYPFQKGRDKRCHSKKTFLS